MNLWRGLAGTGFTAAGIPAVLVTCDGVLLAAPQHMLVLVAPQDKARRWVIQASGRIGNKQLSLIPLGLKRVPVEKSIQFT